MDQAKKINTPGIKEPKSSDSPFSAPEGLWFRCPSCHAILKKSFVLENLNICSECQHHLRLGSRQRLAIFCDENSFHEKDKELNPSDPLNFSDSKPYKDRIKASQAKVGMKDAFVSGEAQLESRKIQVGAFEFSYMGGSMGMVVGEKISRLFDRATHQGQAAVIFSSSGGARMQEGLLSLMQMAKTTAALKRMNDKGLPFISVLCDPTTGGVAASFAAIGDVTIAEPRALVGFAGPRVIQQTIRQELPEGFQTAEFLFKHGMIDAVVHRKDLRSYIDRVLFLLMGKERRT